MPQSRRLAAIMFTDIVGYTAMMQSNQESAMAAVKEFEAVLKDRIASHSGELLQTYGDGSLSVFDSASAAVTCAKEIQEAIREKVPLRIGIHLGEITIDGEHTFGDGVNIASRIESMGTAGAVLMSSSIRQQIKNRPEFQLKSLGRFSFKNVAEPMTVYGLSNEGFVMPKVEEMKGKGERLSSQKNKPLFRWGSLVMVAIFAGAILLWQIGTNFPGSKQLLSKDIREAKIAVGVFENFTGDKNLDALGFMASEWISSGMRELKVRTVSPEMVRKNLDAIGILPNDPNNNISFAEITGAEYIVTGSYFLNGDSITLNTRLSSTETGDDLQYFPQLKDHIDNKEKIVHEARQYMLGYWVLKQDQKLPNINPPKYEAYQVYLKCNLVGASCYQKAIDIDSDFLLARILLMNASGIRGDDSVYTTNKSFIKQRWDQCTEYEKSWFKVASSGWENNTTAHLNAQESIYRLDSNDYLAIHQSAALALVVGNVPELAIKKYERLFSNLDLYKDQVLSWSFEHYMDALNRIKAHQKVTKFYLGLSEPMKNRVGSAAIYNVMQAYIHQNKIAKVRELIEQREYRKKDILIAAYAYNCIYPDSSHNPFFANLQSRVHEFSEEIKYGDIQFLFYDWSSKASAYYVLGEWKMIEELLSKNTDLNSLEFQKKFDTFPPDIYWRKIWHTAFLGRVYAHQGQTHKAYALIKKLDYQDKLYNNKHVVFNRGAVPNLKARIYAILGEKELAVEQLGIAINQGRVFGFWNITFDQDFVNLKKFPPFEELIRPKSQAHFFL